MNNKLKKKKSCDQSSSINLNNSVNKSSIIHLSKSNPNLINNELVVTPNGNGTTTIVTPTFLVPPTNLNTTSPAASLINSSHAIAGLVMASTGSSIVLNVPDYPNTRINYNASSTATSINAPNTNAQQAQTGLDENSFKFIQDAKNS